MEIASNKLLLISILGVDHLAGIRRLLKIRVTDKREASLRVRISLHPLYSSHELNVQKHKRNGWEIVGEQFK